MSSLESNLNAIRSSKLLGELGPRVYEVLRDILEQQTNIAQQVNANPTGPVQPPRPIDSLHVTSADGIFDVRIDDANQVARGTEYFLEYSPTPNFSAPTQIALGPSRNYRANLGNQKLYWRAYSGFRTSAASTPVYFGSAAQPAAVTGGGEASGPAPQPSAGAGSASNTGTQGGHGYGPVPASTPTGRPPVAAPPTPISGQRPSTL